MNTNQAIVVLEEDPLIRRLLERWLGEAGFGIAGPEAKPILVIADVPDPQFAEARIASLRAYAAPILILSARFRHGLAGSADAARRLGVAKVLPKPFTRWELLSAIREALEGSA